MHTEQIRHERCSWRECKWMCADKEYFMSLSRCHLTISFFPIFPRRRHKFVLSWGWWSELGICTKKVTWNGNTRTCLLNELARTQCDRTDLSSHCVPLSQIQPTELIIYARYNKESNAKDDTTLVSLLDTDSVSLQLVRNTCRDPIESVLTWHWLVFKIYKSDHNSHKIPERHLFL